MSTGEEFRVQNSEFRAEGEGARYVVDLREAGEVAMCGGKGAKLAELLRAGFDVPGGFVVTTAGYRLWQQSSEKAAGLPGDFRGAVVSAYRKMREEFAGNGRLLVAVRSSATAEDMAEASMAGQYATHLNVADEAGVLRAVELCFLSLDSARTRAYLGQHGMTPEGVAMAVVVQRQAEAVVAGVLFTANPHSGDRGEMVVESTWGLGEALVSGISHPDTFVLDARSGEVRERHIVEKQLQIAAGSEEACEVAGEMRNAASLTDGELAELHRLGVRVVEAFGGAQDVEWAVEKNAEGKSRVLVLQTRPITTLSQADAYAELVVEVKEQVRGVIASGRGPLVLHNLAETLPHPTVLTWDVIGPFMKGGGGFGKMYRMAGFEPSKDAEEKGFLELVAGKIYMDASRAAEMFFAGFPYRYDGRLLKTDPDAAQGPPTVATGSMRERMRANRRVKGAQRKLSELSRTFAEEFSGRDVPAFWAWCEKMEGRELGAMRDGELMGMWEEVRVRVLDDFATKSLLPSLIAGELTAELRGFLAEVLWEEDGDAGEAAQRLATPLEMDKTLEANAGLYALGRAEAGERAGLLAAWLKEFGHRGPEEFDLAAARWRERGDAVLLLAQRLGNAPDPAERHAEHVREVREFEMELKGKMSRRQRMEFEELVARTRRNMVFREDGKFYLMRGYGLLRRIALEAGKRLGIGEDVFLLTVEEMRAGLEGKREWGETIGRRKLRRHAEKRLQLPHFVEGAEWDHAGQEDGAAARKHAFGAFCLSRGVAVGEARIVMTPEQAATRDLGEKYVLVCPSTDPNWTPLFMNAVGLVLERGGSLSHGAVVAREMGIPAVVLREATRLLKENERVAVDADGSRVLTGESIALRAKHEGRRKHGKQMVPPIGAWERACNWWGLWMAVVWGVVLGVVFLLPEDWVYQRVVAGMDGVLWPMVRGVGRVGTVAILAGAMALLMMVMQRFCTDTKRLRVAKERGKVRGKGLLPEVQGRLLGAALFPVGLFLGPMVLLFAWMPMRMDPAGFAPGAPATATVVATVVGSPAPEDRAVKLIVPPEMTVEGEKIKTVPPIRETLEELLREMEADKQVSKEKVEDLRAYLRKGIPEQKVQWKLGLGAGAEGRYAVRVEAGGDVGTVYFTVGETMPPGPRVCDLSWPKRMKRVLMQVELIAGPSQVRAFWRPFAGVVGGKLGNWDCGWLVVYLVVYLPVMLLGKRFLRVP